MTACESNVHSRVARPGSFPDKFKRQKESAAYDRYRALMSAGVGRTVGAGDGNRTQIILPSLVITFNWLPVFRPPACDLRMNWRSNVSPRRTPVIVGWPRDSSSGSA